MKNWLLYTFYPTEPFSRFLPLITHHQAHCCGIRLAGTSKPYFVIIVFCTSLPPFGGIWLVLIEPSFFAVVRGCCDSWQVFDLISQELESKVSSSATAAKIRGGGGLGEVTTTPIEGMKPGTSGLRKKVRRVVGRMACFAQTRLD